MMLLMFFKTSAGRVVLTPRLCYGLILPWIIVEWPKVKARVLKVENPTSLLILYW